MTKKIVMASCLPPYPRLGEIYRTFAVAVDTKARHQHIDRLAREGDYNWSLMPDLAEGLIVAPLKKYTDCDFSDLVNQFIQNVHSSYIHLISTVQLDSMSREDALPLLVEYYFSSHGCGLIESIKKKFDGPDLMALFDLERHPISVVLDWFSNGNTQQLVNVAFPKTTVTDKKDREMVDRWIKGTQLPDITSIKLFADALLKHGSIIQQEKTVNLRRWLVVGRALSWLENASPVPLRRIMRQHQLSGFKASDIVPILAVAVDRAGKTLSALALPVRALHENLKRTTTKSPGDQANTKLNLEGLKVLLADHDPEGRTQFHLEWLIGRWHVLSGDLKKSLIHYEAASKLANYRGGINEKKIIEEALVIAGYLGKRSLLKQLKNRAISFGLFSNPQEHVIDDWEIEQFRQQFHLVFPAIGRFPEAEFKDISDPHLPFLVFDLKDISGKSADLRKPDRVFTVRFPDGQTRGWPQLRLFASVGRLSEVSKLLDRGADVDQLDEHGGSALLCAIQHAMEDGQREVLDLLLQQKHSVATLEKATSKKKLTPLICAVDYGEPDVVEQLLIMGAIANRRGNVVDQTPLHLCVENMGIVLSPAKAYKVLFQSLSTSPDLVQREVLRRYNVNFAGVFGEGKGVHDLLEIKEYREIFSKLISELVRDKVNRLSLQKLIQIAELLLKHGANPNVPHSYPVLGRTPFMLAAENNSGMAFSLLLQQGGDPYLKDALGLNCIQIALGFGSHEVIRCLQQNGVM